MPIDVFMTQLSPTMTEGKVVRWLKKEGDQLESGEVMAGIETDKATMEMEVVVGIETGIGAEFGPEAIFRVREAVRINAAAKPVILFEHQRTHALLGAVVRYAHAADAGSDNDHVILMHTSDFSSLYRQAQSYSH